MDNNQHSNTATDTEQWVPDRAMIGLATLEGLMVPGKEDLTDIALDSDGVQDPMGEWVNLAELFTELLIFVVDLEAGEREIPVERYIQGLRERILQRQGEGLLFARY